MKFIRPLPAWKSLGADQDEKSAYASLVASESADDIVLSAEELRPRRKSLTRRILSTGGRVLVIVLAILGLLSVGPLCSTVWKFMHSPSEKFAPSLYPSCSCGGTTTEEAKARGCIFTPLAISWLPPHCVDMELSDEFDKLGPGPNGEWDYWADLNKTQRLTREEVGALADYDGVFYTTQEWHVMHCLFTWQKHYRSKWTGVTIERRSNGLDHIGHCGGVFRLEAKLQDIRTVAGIALDADDPGETSQ